MGVRVRCTGYSIPEMVLRSAISIFSTPKSGKNMHYRKCTLTVLQHT